MPTVEVQLQGDFELSGPGYDELCPQVITDQIEVSSLWTVRPSFKVLYYKVSNHFVVTGGLTLKTAPTSWTNLFAFPQGVILPDEMHFIVNVTKNNSHVGIISGGKSGSRVLRVQSLGLLSQGATVTMMLNVPNMGERL